MIYFNTSLDIGAWISHATSDVTGSLTITLLLVIVFLLLVALLFRIPMVLAGLFMLPLFVVFAVYEGSGGLFYTILTIFGVILAWQFAKIIMGWGR
jgi:hypothetical protein